MGASVTVQVQAEAEAATSAEVEGEGKASGEVPSPAVPDDRTPTSAGDDTADAAASALVSLPAKAVEGEGEVDSLKKASVQKSKTKKQKGSLLQAQTRISVVHCDLIKDEFWDAHPGILAE